MGTPDVKPAANPMDRVNEVLSKVETAEDGKINFGDMDVSEELKIAVVAEKRRRDTQAAYTRNQQSLKLKEAEIEALKTLVPKAISDLPEEEQERLDTLKYEDPEAWRREMNLVEAKAREKAEALAAEAISDATSKATKEFQLAERAALLEEFNKANPQTPLTDEQLAYDIPMRLTKQLEDGKITFGELLTKAHEYINTGKTVINPTTLGQPSMSKAPSDKDGGKQTSESLKQAYENQLF